MAHAQERARSVHTPEGGVVLDISKGRMFSLNTTGSVIYQLLEQGLPESRIVEEMVKRFSIPHDMARNDFATFCRSLKDCALPTPGTDSAEE